MRGGGGEGDELDVGREGRKGKVDDDDERGRFRLGTFRSRAVEKEKKKTSFYTHIE